MCDRELKIWVFWDLKLVWLFSFFPTNKMLAIFADLFALWNLEKSSNIKKWGINEESALSQISVRNQKARLQLAYLSLFWVWTDNRRLRYFATFCSTLSSAQIPKPVFHNLILVRGRILSIKDDY